MQFDLKQTVVVLKNTPQVLQSLLHGCCDDWTKSNEGGESWSAYDILGHLIHGEKTDWIARLKKILGEDPDQTFASFDRFAQFEESAGKTISELLVEFSDFRKKNIDFLLSKNIQPFQLEMVGYHPTLGVVTLLNLLSTWAVHDMVHIAQMARVMSKQYKENIGPWTEYYRLLQDV